MLYVTNRPAAVRLTKKILKTLTEKEGVSLSQIARKFAVNKGTLSDIIKGRREPSDNLMVSLGIVFGEVDYEVWKRASAFQIIEILLWANARPTGQIDQTHQADR